MFRATLTSACNPPTAKAAVNCLLFPTYDFSRRRSRSRSGSSRYRQDRAREYRYRSVAVEVGELPRHRAAPAIRQHPVHAATSFEPRKSSFSTARTRGPVHHHHVIQYPLHLRLDHRAQASHELAVERTVAGLPPGALHARAPLTVGTLRQRADLVRGSRGRRDHRDSRRRDCVGPKSRARTSVSGW